MSEVIAIKVIHIITGLGCGGAEMMLLKLVEKTYQDVEIAVISLTDVGSIGEKLLKLDVDVQCLNMQRSKISFLAFFRLFRYLRASDADVVHTWMYHANLMGGLANKFIAHKPLVWSIHHDSASMHNSSRMTILVSRISAWVSSWVPTKIVYCSQTAKEHHEKAGYDKKRSVVINNGIDCAQFKPNKHAYIALRKERHLSDDAFIIGYIARYDKLKDHATFMEAAKLFLEQYPDVHFVLCGDGINTENRELLEMCLLTKREDMFHFLGRRDDVAFITAALDIATSSSISESFSLTIGEAMASGVPCVITASGGPELLLDGHGLVVPVRSPKLLAQAWIQIINMNQNDKYAMLQLAKKRVAEFYSVGVMVEHYQSLYQSLLGRVNR